MFHSFPLPGRTHFAKMFILANIKQDKTITVDTGKEHDIAKMFISK